MNPKLSLSFTLVARLAAVVLAAALSGCPLDGNSDSTETASTPPPDVGAATVGGTVYAANVAGSTVSIFAADAQGKPTGTALATATTDAQGRYTLTLASAPGGPVIVVATGGTYTSEADGSTQTLGTFSTLLAGLSGGANVAQIDPVTNTIAAAASNLLVQGGGSVAAALTSATGRVTDLFGLKALSAAPGTTAADPTATSGDAWLLAALAGTLEQLRVNAAIAPADLYQALRDDVADGKIDGLANGQPVTIGNGGGALTASLFTTQWSGAANAYGVANPTFAAATATISGALQTSGQAAGVAIGSSGSIAPLQTQAGGTQLYFAARADGLVRLDMSDPANPVATKVAAINDAVMLNATVVPATGYYTSLDGIVINPTPINTANGPKVFALLYSYRSKVVVSVNLTDGVVAEVATLNIVKTTGFSGASASIAGGIADGVRSKIWLATGDGLLGLDPSNLTAAQVSIAQPALTQINENLGGDPAKGIIYSPDYDNRGLVIFNLPEARAYVMDAATWSTTTGGWVTAEIDGAALDSIYNVAILTPEGGTTIGLLTYTAPSGSTDAVGTIPTGARFKSFAPNDFFAGSAIDPVTHTALFVGESTRLGVGVLDDPAGANWLGFSKFVTAGTSIYRFSPHDPHTVGAFNVGGKPYGFLLQGSGKPYKVVVVDMAAWLAAPATASNVLITDPMTNPAVTKLLSY